MTAGDIRRVAYYRQIAAEITALAKKTQDPEVRRELLDLAERFRRLADHVERRASGPRQPR